MDITPLPVGVEVADLPLDKPLAPAHVVAFRRMLAKHQLLLFRGQDISPQDQIRVMETFGKVLDERQDGLFYQYVSGEKAAIGPHRLLFHLDTHYTPVPLECLSLYGEQVGEAATPTLFADSVAAYARLSPRLQQRLEGLMAINRSFFYLGLSNESARHLSPELKDGPIGRHPAVCRHPVTGAPWVYLSDMHSYMFEGLSNAESIELLEEVFATLYDPAYLLEHKWADGDLIVWNNRTVQHARGILETDTGEPGLARSIRRVSTGTLTFSDQFEFTPEILAAIDQAKNTFYREHVGAAGSGTM